MSKTAQYISHVQRHKRVRSTNAYMTQAWRHRLLQEVDDAGFILFDYLLTSANNPHFNFEPEAIQTALHWSAAKLKRQQKKLRDSDWFHTVKGRRNDGVITLDVFLGQNEVLAAKAGLVLPYDTPILNKVVKKLGLKATSPNDVETALRHKDFKKEFVKAREAHYSLQQASMVSAHSLSHSWLNDQDNQRKMFEIKEYCPEIAQTLAELIVAVEDGSIEPEDGEVSFHQLYADFEALDLR